MEDLLHDVIKEVPSLAVLAFIVWTFVKHLVQANNALKELHSDTMIRVEKMAHDLHETARDCHSVQMRSVDALARNSEALDHFSETIDKWAEHRPTNGRAA